MTSTAMETNNNIDRLLDMLDHLSNTANKKSRMP